MPTEERNRFEIYIEVPEPQDQAQRGAFIISARFRDRFAARINQGDQALIQRHRTLFDAAERVGGLRVITKETLGSAGLQARLLQQQMTAAEAERVRFLVAFCGPINGVNGVNVQPVSPEDLRGHQIAPDGRLVALAGNDVSPIREVEVFKVRQGERTTVKRPGNGFALEEGVSRQW